MKDKGMKEWGNNNIYLYQKEEEWIKSSNSNETDMQADRQTDKQTDGQVNKPTWTDRWTDRQKTDGMDVIVRQAIMHNY